MLNLQFTSSTLQFFITELSSSILIFEFNKNFSKNYIEKSVFINLAAGIKAVGSIIIFDSEIV